MTVERFHTSARSSKFVKHNNTVYLSGQVGAGETLEEQAHDCLARIDALLKESGSTREHILQAVIWLTDMSYFAAFNEIWNAWVPEGHAPARACGEAKLAREILKVEIIITAAIAS